MLQRYMQRHANEDKVDASTRVTATHWMHTGGMLATLLGLTVSLAGCGQSVGTSSQNGMGSDPGDDDPMEVSNNEEEPYMEDHDHIGHETQIFSTPMEVEQAFSDGEVEFRSEHPFAAIQLQIVSYRYWELEYTYERTDGTRAAWMPVVPDEAEVANTSSSIILPSGQKTSAVFVRTVAPSMEIEYLGARFFEEVPESGVLDAHYEGEEDAQEGMDTQDQPLTRTQLLSRPGRYVPPASVVAAGRSQYVSYEGGPAWSPSRCSGSFRSGTRALAEHIVARFSGASYYQGYSCRANTASPSRMSIHGTGRAIDVFIPTYGGQADNDLGDPVANWLITNAEVLGIQYFIWDRTSWGAARSGDKHRRYTGPHPHHDHLHIELTSAAAGGNAPWFRDPNSATDTPGGDPGANNNSPPFRDDGIQCNSSTLGRRVDSGACVQMPYVKFGGRCNWSVCNTRGQWVEQADPGACPGTSYNHDSCDASTQPEPDPATESPCYSRTLGSHVASGSCVQVDYNPNSCQQCGWFMCRDGGWVCTDAGACSADADYPHANCTQEGEELVNRLTFKLKWSEETDLDLFVEEPSGDVISYRSNVRSTDDGLLHNNNSCRGSNCSNLSKPFYEKAIWGELTEEITTGTYTFWVENYNGRTASSFEVIVHTHRRPGETLFEQTIPLTLPAQEDAVTEKTPVTISE